MEESVSSIEKDSSDTGNSGHSDGEEASQSDRWSKSAKIQYEKTEPHFHWDIDVLLRSCEQEIVDPIEGVIHGTIPDWLTGSLLRNGPGGLKVGEMEFNHLFDGAALLHRFNIENGRITYQCRFLKSDTYTKNKAAGRIVVSEFGTNATSDPLETIFRRIATIFCGSASDTSDNCLVSIYPFGDEYFAFTENPVIRRIDPKTLDTEAKLKVSDYVDIVSHTAHPHVMPNGTVYNLGCSITRTGPAYTISCFPNGENMFENARIVASVPTRWKLHPGYMHSFGITENFFVIVEQPFSISVPVLLFNRIMNKSIAGALKWFDNQSTYIYLLDRNTGKLRHTFHAEPYFYLHIINQYEKDDHVILDICCYDDPGALNGMYIDTMRNMHQNPEYAKMFCGRPLRFVLPFNETSSASVFARLRSCIGSRSSNLNQKNLITLENTEATAYAMPNGTVFCKPELLCNASCEFPQIYHEKYMGREYRYFYAINSDMRIANPGMLYKIDVVNKTQLIWCEENVYPSEPIFVPSPDPQSEDDGVVLAALVWGHGVENRVGLLILDAQTFEEIARAEFETPSPVPKCLHGWFQSATK